MLKLTGSFDTQGVPDVDVEIVVAGHQESAGLGESDGGDATDNVIVGVLSQLLGMRRDSV